MPSFWSRTPLRMRSTVEGLRQRKAGTLPKIAVPPRKPWRLGAPVQRIEAVVEVAERATHADVADRERSLGQTPGFRIQQRQLAAIVESSEDAIISKTLDGRITSWNRAAQALFGYTPDEAIGQRVQMLIPPERQSEEMRILEDLALGRTVPTFNTVRQARDGTRLDVSITVSPIRDEAGRIVGASKIARDIRAQRRAEIALRESEARLRFALEAAQIGDWDLDLGTGVMRRSIRHDRCFGYDTLQSEWGIETFLRHVHPAHRAEVARAFFVAASQAQPWQTECRVRWPDGSEHWIAAKEIGRAHV